jgi:hypothetical protein
VQDVAPKRVV